MAWEEEGERLKWEEEGGSLKCEEEEQQRLIWEEEQEWEEVRIRLVEEKEALILQGTESESESMHWGGRNGCNSEGVRTKNPEKTDFLRDCDDGEQEGAKRRHCSDDGDRTLVDEEDEDEEDEDEDEEKKKEEEERRERRGSRSDSLHFFLEQLVGDEGWRECVEVPNLQTNKKHFFEYLTKN